MLYMERESYADYAFSLRKSRVFSHPLKVNAPRIVAFTKAVEPSKVMCSHALITRVPAYLFGIVLAVSKEAAASISSCWSHSQRQHPLIASLSLAVTCTTTCTWKASRPPPLHSKVTNCNMVNYKYNMLQYRDARLFFK